MHRATRLFATSGVRARHAVLLLALLPMLTYMGHWPSLEFPIPGTGAYWQLPFSDGWGAGHDDSAGHSHSHDTEEGDHAQHCHTNMGSCLVATVGAIAAAAILMAVVAFIGRASRLVGWETAAQTPPLDWLAAPLTPPPRLLSGTV
jgi:hypothetical protein